MDECNVEASLIDDQATCRRCWMLVSNVQKQKTRYPKLVWSASLRDFDMDNGRTACVIRLTTRGGGSLSSSIDRSEILEPSNQLQS